MNCVIIDDEPLAREGIANYVREVDFLNLVQTCQNPVELLNLVSEHKIDLLFLDIQMPKMNGIDFLKTVQNSPIVIITTAFPSYALESFQLNVLDYLLKPITFDRFYKAVSKAKDYYQLITKAVSTGIETAGQTDQYFFIKCDNKYEKIVFDDILYIQGMQNYVIIFTQKGKYVTLLYLKNLEQNLDSKSFIRVHKSYIVSIDKIDAIDGNEIMIKSHRIPISRNYREQIIQQVVKNKLWIK
ncbi:LytTR family DNA-binding domain-containing protein [Larkinella knui]|uniref:DNA-binding response regulator n=1 Tax=Larkinella knui TaxID=2025310 RepID=A0A3P1CVY0_9BACT|nr:LytTR family DNA-binding domain-containing protein [Larkinella knui]RRB17471.1 DNA-binding response regulator [Larkinella knui]